MTKQQLTRHLEWLPYFGAKWKQERLADERKAYLLERVKRISGIIAPTPYISTELVKVFERATMHGEDCGAMKIAPKGIACETDNPLCENLEEWITIPPEEAVDTIICDDFYGGLDGKRRVYKLQE